VGIFYKVYLIDVRDSDKFAKGSLKTAVNIPVNNLEDKIKALPKDKKRTFPMKRLYGRFTLSRRLIALIALSISLALWSSTLQAASGQAPGRTMPNRPPRIKRSGLPRIMASLKR
jgi:hypothetical protein